MRNTIRTTAVGAVVALLLGGCGAREPDTGPADGPVVDPGRDSSDAGVLEVVDLVAGALVSGDGPRVCSLLSAEAQRAFERSQGSGDCIAAVSAASEGAEGRALDALRDPSGWEVSREGDRALVTGGGAAALAAVLGTGTVSLARVEGRWVVADRP